MSTLTITFETQFVDFPRNPTQRLTVRFNNGTQVLDLFEDLVQGVPAARQFQEVAWIDGVSGEDDLQAARFAQAFNRDYKTIGSELLPLGPSGLPQKNMVAQASGNVVTITAQAGTFENDSSWNGNVLSSVVFGTPDNVPLEDNPLFTIANLNTGNCSTVNFRLTATNGSGTYKIIRDGVDILTGWDGSQTDIVFQRGKTNTVIVEDTNGNQSDPRQVFVPRQLNAQEFGVSLFQYEGSADVTITEDNPIASTGPLEYALEPQGTGSGSNYQSSNIFSGIIAGTYELFVRDVYGCEVTRTIEVTGTGVSDGTVIDTFIISPMNSLSFARRDDLRPGYENRLSYEEVTRIARQDFLHFTPDQAIQTQFKSSYPYHEIEVRKCDGTFFTVIPVLIQENLGVTEKVDCELIALSGTEIAVYFNGGNAYVKGTTTVDGASPYSSQLPPWAEAGNFARFDALGVKEITGFTYLEDLNRLAFVVQGNLGADQADKVQATFNRHDYNVYRADFDMSLVSNLAFMTIKAGWAAGDIIETWVSETMKLLTETEDWLKIEWDADRVVEDMLFIDGIRGKMWLKGRLRPIGETTTENYQGTEEVYPIDADAVLGMQVSVPRISAKLWHKFILISGLSKVGRVYIEDQLLIRKAEVEITPIGVTNLYSITGDFFFEDEGLTVREGEEVFDVDTGQVVIPELPLPGSETGKIPVESWAGFTRLILDDGTYLKLSSGWFVAL